MTALLSRAAVPESAPQPDPFRPAEPIPPYPPEPRNHNGAPTYTVDAVDAMACEAEAAHRIGNGEAADYACGRHRFEVVSAHWRREANLPIYDLPEGNGHVCNEVRRTEADR